MTFEALLRETENFLAAHPQAQQAVSVWTVRGNLRQFFSAHIMEGDHSEEDAFLSMLREKGEPEVQKLVCLFRDTAGWPELASYHLRQGLAELDPANADALLLLQGETGPVVKRLGATLHRPE